MFFRHQKLLPKDKMLVNSLVLMSIMITFDYLFIDRHPVPTDTEDKTEKKKEMFDDIELDDIDLDEDGEEDNDDEQIYDIKKRQQSRVQPQHNVPPEYYNREIRGYNTHQNVADGFQPYNA